VEVHAPWDVAACRRSLERLGFDTTPDAGGILSVTALRRG
jgi:hypothetical protein